MHLEKHAVLSVHLNMKYGIFSDPNPPKKEQECPLLKYSSTEVLLNARVQGCCGIFQFQMKSSKIFGLSEE